MDNLGSSWAFLGWWMWFLFDRHRRFWNIVAFPRAQVSFAQARQLVRIQAEGFLHNCSSPILCSQLHRLFFRILPDSHQGIVLRLYTRHPDCHTGLSFTPSRFGNWLGLGTNQHLLTAFFARK